MCRSLCKQKGQQIIVNITVEYNVNFVKHAVLYVHFCAVVHCIDTERYDNTEWNVGNFEIKIL